MTIRELYLEQQTNAARLEASREAQERHIAELKDVVARWEERVRLPLPADVAVAAAELLARYREYLESAEAVRKRQGATQDAIRKLLDSLLETLAALGGEAARAGIDTRALPVEVNLGDLQREARRANALAMIEAGAFEPDAELAFLDELFERGLHHAPAQPPRG